VRTVLLRCPRSVGINLGDGSTIFQDTRTSLRLWFQAMWWLTTQKKRGQRIGTATGAGTEKGMRRLDIAA